MAGHSLRAEFPQGFQHPGETGDLVATGHSPRAVFPRHALVVRQDSEALRREGQEAMVLQGAWYEGQEAMVLQGAWCEWQEAMVLQGWWCEFAAEMEQLACEGQQREESTELVAEVDKLACRGKDHAAVRQGERNKDCA